MSLQLLTLHRSRPPRLDLCTRSWRCSSRAGQAVGRQRSDAKRRVGGDATFNDGHVSRSLTASEGLMTRHLVAKVLLATALAVGGACSSGDGAPNEGTSG